ncbi:MAG: glycoside hydrolase family 16 protein [Acidobacteria bacterium]|nr:glycoside hydrolase family 16 protein [Acidobacteriota bacterium]
MIGLTAFFSVIATSCGSSQTKVTPPPPPPSYQLTWSDEFTSTNGSLPDSSKWVMETGGAGWGNNELETYTNRTQNAHVQDGNLMIIAAKETYTGSDGITRQYTSARLKTAGLFDQKYGRFEARIQIPQGQGMWPAFWMLGNNVGTAGWPDCGEIDIMENIGKEPDKAHGSMHGPGYSGANGLSGMFTLPSGKFADGYHLFAVEWEPSVVRFYVDSNLYETRTPADLPSGTTWVFDHPFFLLLNVAVGGDWPGSPDNTTVFPQNMLVDYVRVYSKK